MAGRPAPIPLSAFRYSTDGVDLPSVAVSTVNIQRCTFSHGLVMWRSFRCPRGHSPEKSRRSMMWTACTALKRKLALSWAPGLAGRPSGAERPWLAGRPGVAGPSALPSPGLPPFAMCCSCFVLHSNISPKFMELVKLYEFCIEEHLKS